jgi:hypothetical protein
VLREIAIRRNGRLPGRIASSGAAFAAPLRAAIRPTSFDVQPLMQIDPETVVEDERRCHRRRGQPQGKDGVNHRKLDA